MTKSESTKLRKKNNCSTCERRSNHVIGCQIFKGEPENCWAWTSDKDWLKKADKACKEYKEGRVTG